MDKAEGTEKWFKYAEFAWFGLPKHWLEKIHFGRWPCKKCRKVGKQDRKEKAQTLTCTGYCSWGRGIVTASGPSGRCKGCTIELFQLGSWVFIHRFSGCHWSLTSSEGSPQAKRKVTQGGSLGTLWVWMKRQMPRGQLKALKTSAKRCPLREMCMWKCHCCHRDTNGKFQGEVSQETMLWGLQHSWLILAEAFSNWFLFQISLFCNEDTSICKLLLWTSP